MGALIPLILICGNSLFTNPRVKADRQTITLPAFAELPSQKIIHPEDWLEEQLSMPPSSLLNQLEAAAITPTDERAIEQFWRDAYRQAPDQLRQRLALALSRIFQLSFAPDGLTSVYAQAQLFDIFLDRAFGNYEDLLYTVSLHPIAGHQGAYLNNPLSVPEWGWQPNNRFACQLLSGLTLGQPVEHFSEQEIKGLGQVFTGLGAGELTEFGYLEGYENPEFGVPYFAIDPLVPMQFYADFHESSAKLLPGGFRLPAGQSGEMDLQQALRHLVQQPQTAQHLSRTLLRELWQMEPTEDKVTAVAAVFRDNGNGVCGDLAAVVRAILIG